MGSNINMRPWEVDNKLVGFIIINGQYTSSVGSQHLYIPSIMPNISLPTSRPQTAVRSLSKSCVCNDSKCMPPIGNAVTVQNYITVPPNAIGFKHSVLYNGALVKVNIGNKNIDNLIISPDIDNSTEPPY